MIITLISALFLACESFQIPEDDEEVLFSVNSVTWLIESLDPTIWGKEPEGISQMFVSFYVSYNGVFRVSEINEIIIESPEDEWILEQSHLKKITDINRKTKIAEIKRLRCGTGKGAVPLGKWRVRLNHESGYKYTQILDVYGFDRPAAETVIRQSLRQQEEGQDTDVQSTGSEQELEFSLKKGSSYRAVVPLAETKQHVEALSRPRITAITKQEDAIEITFSVNDKRVKNGYFWFDVPGEKYYKDSGSMIDADGNPVNGCKVFYTDGQEGFFVFKKTAENTPWFDKIINCYFVVSDVNRAAGLQEERVRSVSARAAVK